MIALTMVSTDVNPFGALHDMGPLQNIVVGLPLYFMLKGTHFALCLCICQVTLKMNSLSH